MNEDVFDCVIVGAGIVGSCAALALISAGLRVAVIEACPLIANPSPAARVLALNTRSVTLLDDLGVWKDLYSEANIIEHLQVSRRGHFTAVRIGANECHVPFLGYVVLADRLLAALYRVLFDRLPQSHLQLIYPACLETLVRCDLGWKLDCVSNDRKQRTLYARLLIAADGTFSKVRELVGISTKILTCDRTALVSRVRFTVNAARSCVYQRFTDRGVLAILPFSANEAGLIWTGKSACVTPLAECSADIFLKEIQDYFGYRLGRFEQVTERLLQPLQTRYARQQVQKNLVLLGNAAHTLSPLAAQGLNLGLHDLAQFIQILTELCDSKSAIASLHDQDSGWLMRYAEARRRQQRCLLQFTEQLENLLSFNFWPLNLVRALALFTLDSVLPCKRRFAHAFMGFA